jgi:hypothetical protein
MELLSNGLVAVVCLAVGAWGYRYMLKKDPERLERWATEIRELRRRRGED